VVPARGGGARAGLPAPAPPPWRWPVAASVGRGDDTRVDEFGDPLLGQAGLCQHVPGVPADGWRGLPDPLGVPGELRNRGDRSLDGATVRVLEVEERAARLDLVREQRAETISVAQIIDRAGTSRQAFYEHFDDRDDAIVAAVRESTGKRLMELTRDLAPEWSSSEALLPLLDEERVLYQNLHGGPVQARAMDTGREALEPVARSLAQELCGTGDSSLVDDVTVFLVGGFLDSIVHWIRLGLTPEQARGRAEDLWDLLVRAVRR